MKSTEDPPFPSCMFHYSIALNVLQQGGHPLFHLEHMHVLFH